VSLKKSSIPAKLALEMVEHMTAEEQFLRGKLLK
jgi:hypothetical protein